MSSPTAQRPLALEFQRSADPDGFLPFDRFMEIALYARDVGYYDQARSPIGVEGDFYTAPQLHPIFGETVGRHVAQELADLPRDAPVRIVELGPGNGELAASMVEVVARTIGAEREIDYLLVERSPRRAESALERALQQAEGTSVRVRLAPSLGDAGPFSGIVVGHEFLDAQPVRRLRRAGGGWEELGVRFDSGELVEASRPLPRAGPSLSLPEPVEDGTVVEISPGIGACLREIADHLVAGRAIFFDYGGEESEIVRSHRLGTLTAMRGHRVLDSILQNPGTSDLSAFVNFTRLRASALRAGLRCTRDDAQAETLVAWGLQEVAEQRGSGATPEDRLRLHMAVKNLLFKFPRFRIVEFAPAGGAA